MKKLSVVAVAVCMLTSSSFAAWDYFTVIEAEKGQATLGTGTLGGFKIRYGIMENLELFATNNEVAGINSGYFIGGRYQIVPEMFAFGLDLGIPVDNSAFGRDIGLIPSVAFTMGINEMISFGIGAELGIGIDHPAPEPGDALATRMLMNLGFGLELDFQLNDVLTAWVGCDFFLEDFTEDNSPDMTIDPSIGLTIAVHDNLILGTKLGIDLNATNREGDDTIGLRGGVEFTISF